MSSNNRVGVICAVFALIAISFFYMFSSAALLIWPTRLHMEKNEKSVAIWIENQGNEEQMLQARAFLWTQKEGKDQLTPQATVMVSPPMAKVAPGAKQLFRVVNKIPAPQGTLQTYRIIVDEIPKKSTPKPLDFDTDVQQGVKFQFRYSIPLFIYGQGLQEKARLALSNEAIVENLSWKVTESSGTRWLEISNKGAYYLHLTGISFDQPAKSTGSGELSGYILPKSTVKWPLPQKIVIGDRLHAILNGKDAIVLSK